MPKNKKRQKKKKKKTGTSFDLTTDSKIEKYWTIFIKLKIRILLSCYENSTQTVKPKANQALFDIILIWFFIKKY